MELRFLTSLHSNLECIECIALFSFYGMYHRIYYICWLHYPATSLGFWETGIKAHMLGGAGKLLAKIKSTLHLLELENGS